MARLRACVEILGERPGGDREAACLVEAVKCALQLAAEFLADLGEPSARGYRDACDRLVACGAVDAELGAELERTCDVAERLPYAWSSVSPGELARALDRGVAALARFAEVAADHLAASPSLPVPTA